MQKTVFNNVIHNHRYFLCFLALAIVYFFNMLIDVMDVDAAQYAAITSEMVRKASYLEVFHRGTDYLDKPPLLFWLSAVSFHLFGISNFTYKLPSVLCLILGIYSTYRFGLQWYDKRRAIIAALILGSTMGYFLMTNDVRADGMLTGFLMFSVWQLSLFLQKGKFANLLAGSIGVAAAMMTKGPLGLVIVGFALGSDLLLKRDWKNIFNKQWVFFLLIIAVCLLPMCYGLYQQFDLHPEKITYGLKGPSGIKFFFWTQSFGRITGDIYWKDDSTFLFFFHTILWVFLPWILFLVPALFVRIKKLWELKFKVPQTMEFMTFFGFLLSFLALSTSRYKLPHYIFPLFPFIAIITADYICHLTSMAVKRYYDYLKNAQYVVLLLLFSLISLIFIYFFPPQSYWLPIVIALLFVLVIILIKNLTDKSDKIIIPTVLASVAVGLVMGLNFYPSILQYQSDSVLGKEIYKNQVPNDRLKYYREHSNSLDFYAHRNVFNVDSTIMNDYKRGMLVHTDQKGKDYIIKEQKMDYKVIRIYEDFPVTRLNINFLKKTTRQSQVQRTYLLEKI